MLFNEIEEKAKKITKDITIVVAGKNRTIKELEEVIKAGATIIGENRAQELLEKYHLLEDKASFHFIGHLQTNKVKDVINKVNLIHSVDSFRLAKEISKQAKKPISILVEVNTTREKNKFGIPEENLVDFIIKTSKLNNLKIQGLMTMGKFTQNPENNRKYFRKLKKLAELIEHKNIPRVEMKYLSMGTSQDFEVAIEEGANIVRIGRSIFEH